MSNRMNPVVKGRSAKRRTGLATVAALSLLLVSCGERPLSTFDARSPIAQKLDSALVFLLIVCGVVLRKPVTLPALLSHLSRCWS